MTAEHVEYEFMFGDTWCLITVSSRVGVSTELAHRALPYVLGGSRGRSLRAVGDREGRPLEFLADTVAGALALASEHLEDRFGPRRAAPAPTTSYVTSYEAEGLQEEPLRDERPEPARVLALERIRRGDIVRVTRDGAKRAAGAIRRRASAGTFWASAIEDVEQGQYGRVRELSEDEF